MNHTQPDRVTLDEYTDDVQCPNCESNNMTDRGHTCNDCNWSMPNISTTEITGDHAPYEKCDHCGREMQIGPCEDCLVSRGLTDDEGDVEAIESDDCILIDNTDSTQTTLDELLEASDIIDADANNPEYQSR